MRKYFSLIKFSHTIFALPFALLGFFIGIHSEGGGFNPRLFVLVILCMVFARSAAMAFNRFLDRDIDQKNPRTAFREIPAGIIKPRAAFFFAIGNSLLFVITTWFINPICFYLSPVALAIVLGYSFTKRFTVLCHFVLGLGLALAPICAYLAVTGHFALTPLLYSGVVLLWVSGFDIIYALQDEDFDKTMNLKSIPATLGGRQALRLSRGLHILCATTVFATAALAGKAFPELGWLSWAAAGIFSASLFYQHTLVWRYDLSKINLAFFTTNGIASLVFGSLMVLDFYL
ncbi:MAG: 4-hydroxybenzoate octaprenyltransferase [Saprospiraceae bacterium]|nr:MAG: 4-hydroxybenzoate octaprenyltransferase [Saprospiraceae bacterium]